MADTELSKAVPASTENTASSSLAPANAVPLKKVNSKSTVSSVKSPVSALPNKSPAVTTSQSSKPTTPKTNVRPTITSVIQVVSLPKSSTVKGNLVANSKRAVSSLSNSRSASSEKIPTVEPVVKKAAIRNVVNVSSGTNSSTKSDASTKHNLDNVEKVSSSTDVVKDTKMGLDSKNAKATGKQISLDTANKIDSKVKEARSTETTDYIKVKVPNNQLPGSNESLISIKSAEDVKKSPAKKPVTDLSDLSVELKTNAKSRITCDTGVQELENGFVCILSTDIIDESCIETSEKYSGNVKSVNEKNSKKREMHPELNGSKLSTHTLQECFKKEQTGDLSNVVSNASNSGFGIPAGASISPACSVVSGSANGNMQPAVKNASVVKEQEVPKVKSSNAIDPTAAVNVSDSLASKQVSSKPCDTSDSKTKSMTVESCNQLVNSSSSVVTENPQSPNHQQISSQCCVDTKCDPVTTATPPEETKQSIRLKVWDRLEKNNYVLFPRPCKGRIPHFVGSPEAAEKLATLENFKNAKNVKVNPDKPQAHIRFLTLEAGKNLLVPVPRLRSGLFKRIVPPAGATKEQLRTVVTQQGVVRFGQPLELNDKVSIDLVIMGAVAVSKEGHRIGKGEGYADLEFAIMMKMGAITKDTIVITTVHDEQVFDTLPNHLFKEHDVPVDFIVTPTQVYEVQPRLPKPSGIFWNILSNRRMQLIPILKTLREQEIAEGKECQLKEVDSDPEDRPVRPIRFFRRISRRRSQTQPKNQRPPRESSAPPATPNARPAQKSRQSRTFRRKPAAARSSSAKEQTTKPVESGNKSERKQHNMVERVRAGGDGVRPIRRRYYRPKTSIAFSIRVSGISQGTRVRDLKTALNERGVKPFDITWESSKGHAVLHFSRIDVGKDKTPQIISEVSSVTTIEGFPAKLEVKLLGNAKHYKYEWFVNGTPVNMSAKHCRVISRIDGIAALIFGNVTLGDAGEYSVVIKNKQGEISSKGFLKVEEKATKEIPESKPEFVKELEEVSADKNTPLAFYADIAGNPVPDVEWSKDGVVLAHNDWIQFLYERNKIGLKINQCRMSDAGVYTCKLTNSLGEANSSAKAIVNTPSRLNQINNITKDITIAMDDIIAALQDLKVKGEGEEDPKDSLCVEPANPISRIESTGISAV